MPSNPTNINQRLSELRQQMQEKQLDAYLIPSSDPHQSEYVAAHWKSREWISGFTGSAGTVVVTQDHAGLWTDSRYFIQAESELAGSAVTLHKQQIPHAPEHIDWIAEQLPAGARVGLDGMLFSVNQVRRLARAFEKKALEIESNYDLVAPIWKNRHPIPDTPIFEHALHFTGSSRADKLSIVRKKMMAQSVGSYFISTLDDIAWLLNLRGSDVESNPVFIAYAIVHQDVTYLFTDSSKVNDPLRETLRTDGILIKDYTAIEAYLSNWKEEILVDKSSTNIRLFNAIQQVRPGANIIRALKAIKSPTEVGHIRNAMLKDGVALTRLCRWLDATLAEQTVTEVEVATKLAGFRAAQEDYHGESFNAIVGYRGNGAIVHYHPMPDSCASITKEGILLLDSGGQYADGTTDITRTFALGPATAEQKRDFTLVLKGHIALAKIKFPKGTMGVQMDILARQALWQHGLNYGHGTGHGVGFFLNVHEPPQGFAASVGPRGAQVFLPGMFTSNEPGFYKNGEYGIRIENLILCVEAEKTAYGEFLAFETLTLFPIDLNLVEASLLTADETNWLNEYHAEVYEKLAPLLEAAEQEWLKDQCRAIDAVS